jgi:osmotically inducible lipoprotein OsmB
MKLVKTLAIALAATASLAACNDPNVQKGATVGALGGALVAGATGGDMLEGAIIGGTGGAIVGGATNP